MLRNCAPEIGLIVSFDRSVSAIRWDRAIFSEKPPLERGHHLAALPERITKGHE
jgi:hypothetical protein